MGNCLPELYVLAKFTEDFAVLCHSGQVTALKMDSTDTSETFRFIKLHHQFSCDLKLDWSVYNCLTQLYGDRDMYIIYYIKNNYTFRHFSLDIFRLINEKLSKQLLLTCAGCIQCGGDLKFTVFREF